MGRGKLSGIVVEILAGGCREFICQSRATQYGCADTDITAVHTECIFHHLATEHRPGIHRDNRRALILERKRHMARPHGQREFALRISRAVGQVAFSSQRFRIDRRLSGGGQVDHSS